MQTQPQAPSELQTLFAELAASLHRAGQIASVISAKTGMAVSIPTLKRPEHIPDDQEWFWSDEWQKMEAEANDAIAKGQVSQPFATIGEALTFLDQQV
ncbi:MAG: hypothetical protein KF716_20075 [Anaerolineae bacterium]|nr:hypothetical protein [Anaerolineae bacterium]